MMLTNSPAEEWALRRSPLEFSSAPQGPRIHVRTECVTSISHTHPGKSP